MFPNQKPRRYISDLSILGNTQLHLRNPWCITWWSCAFPGFGHLLLSKYIRGFALIGWEILINFQAKINLAMVYSFSGQFDLAKSVIDVRWMSLYVPVYLFAIYDSYRTTIDLNHIYKLADRMKIPTRIFKMNALEINYLDKRKPWVAVAWSILMPGMGQLFIHRIISATFTLAGWIVISYFSHFYEGIHYTFMGEFTKAKEILEMQWLLFLPSIHGFAIYDAYTNTVEINKLFDKEQSVYLIKKYQPAHYVMPLKLM